MEILGLILLVIGIFIGGISVMMIFLCVRDEKESKDSVKSLMVSGFVAAAVGSVIIFLALMCYGMDVSLALKIILGFLLIVAVLSFLMSLKACEKITAIICAVLAVSIGVALILTFSSDSGSSHRSSSGHKSYNGASDYIKDQAPDLYEDIVNRYNNLK